MAFLPLRPLETINLMGSGVYLLAVLLAGTTTLKLLSTSSNGSDVISQSSDLNCVGTGSRCRWRNASPIEHIDDFDWGLGEGRPDAIRWRMLTGSDSVPR